MWLTMARPRPVPRPLVEKYGRNSFSLSSGRDAAAGVGDHQFHGFGGAGLGGDVELLDQRVLHGFGGVVDQVHHHALELFAVEVHGGSPGAKLVRMVDAVQAPVKDGERVATPPRSDRTARAAPRESARTARTRPPGSSRVSTLLRDGVGAFVQDARGSRGQVEPLELSARCVRRRARWASADS